MRISALIEKILIFMVVDKSLKVQPEWNLRLRNQKASKKKPWDATETIAPVIRNRIRNKKKVWHPLIGPDLARYLSTCLTLRTNSSWSMGQLRSLKVLVLNTSLNQGNTRMSPYKTETGSLCFLYFGMWFAWLLVDSFHCFIGGMIII